MAKNPNHRQKAVKQDSAMTGAMKLFLGGCVAELYLLIIRRFYIYGTLEQVVAWDEYLKVFAGAGLAVALAGIVLSMLWKAEKGKRIIGWALTGAGVFVGFVSFIVRYHLSLLTLFYITVPVIMLLGILWYLYDRESATGLSILGVSLLSLWACRRAAFNLTLSVYAKAIAVVVILVLVAAALALRTASASGKVGKYQIFPGKFDPRTLYAICAVGAVALATVLISPVVSYYAMLALAALIFALAVFYTVKQL